MSYREHIKKEIDTLPDSIIIKLHEYIIFQKISNNLIEIDKATIRDIETASLSSTGFWNNPDDEVWDHV